MQNLIRCAVNARTLGRWNADRNRGRFRTFSTGTHKSSCR